MKLILELFVFLFCISVLLAFKFGLITTIIRLKKENEELRHISNDSEKNLYLVQFDGNWETIKKIRPYCFKKCEIVCTVMPILGVELNNIEDLEKIRKIEGVINIEKNYDGGYLTIGDENV